jgi:ElaB/YqjD/DUF883 family membrane-anchored ribosome-binding protein
MKSEVLEKVTEFGCAAVQLRGGAEHVKKAAADAVENGVRAAERAVKQGRRAAEDLVDDAEHQVKRHPLGALGASFGVGLGLGAMLGILLTRNGHSVAR